jgi:hypothetical protein
VVVKYLDAVVADGAVGAAGRPVELTRHTPLHPYLHTNNTNIGNRLKISSREMSGYVREMGG